MCLLLSLYHSWKMLCLFVSYNSIHLPGPLCTKCISPFISKYSFFFLALSLFVLLLLFTMPIRARFLLGLMVCDEGRFECLSVCFFSFFFFNIAHLVISASDLFSHSRHCSPTFYKFCTLPPPTQKCNSPFTEIRYLYNCPTRSNNHYTLPFFYTYKKT